MRFPTGKKRNTKFTLPLNPLPSREGRFYPLPWREREGRGGTWGKNLTSLNANPYEKYFLRFVQVARIPHEPTLIGEDPFVLERVLVPGEYVGALYSFGRT